MSEIKARFSPNTKIQVCCDAESSRYSLGGIHISPGEGGVWATATDGRHMAIVKYDGEADKPQLVPTDVLPTRKGDLNGNYNVTLNGRWEGDNGRFADTPTGRFPHACDVVPNLPPGVIQLAIDPTYLSNLQKALNSDQRGLTLFITPPAEGNNEVEHAVAVVGQHGIGIVMPLSGSGDDRDKYDEQSSEYAKAFRQVE